MLNLTISAFSGGSSKRNIEKQIVRLDPCLQPCAFTQHHSCQTDPHACHTECRACNRDTTTENTAPARQDATPAPRIQTRATQNAKPAAHSKALTIRGLEYSTERTNTNIRYKTRYTVHGTRLHSSYVHVLCLTVRFP